MQIIDFIDQPFDNYFHHTKGEYANITFKIEVCPYKLNLKKHFFQIKTPFFKQKPHIFIIKFINRS